MNEPVNHRILLVDDNPAIHEDFRKILNASKQRNETIEYAELILLGVAVMTVDADAFQIDSALQGREALEKVTAALKAKSPYAMAFVDVRMPPGWDGIETIEHLWNIDPALQVVLCTAYSDYSWEKMAARLGINDKLIILKKPFDNIEVLHLAHALTSKWNSAREVQRHVEELDRRVAQRTLHLRAANDELRRSEERFGKAFNASPVGLAIQTLDDSIFVDVNEAFAIMAGIPRDELIGQTPGEVRLGLDFPPAIPADLHEGRPVRNAETQIRTRSGEVRQALVSFEHIMLGGEPHVLLLAQDISERLRLEEQLRHSQKMDAVGQLAAGIAHDFNNELTIIEGHASLQLGMPELPAEVAESFTQIEQAAERAANLTRQLLAFSRRQIMRPRLLSLSAIIRDLAAMLRRLLSENVALRCELSNDLPMIFADQTSIEQVLMNLVLNARDAMPKGGEIFISTIAETVPASDCEAGSEARAGDFVCLRVRDTGAGMDEPTRVRIFEPFFTTKEQSQGTGMGLATVHGIVHQHEGWIKVTTKHGEGSSFLVFLPVSPQENIAPPPSPEPEKLFGSGQTILVAEDDPAVRSFVKDVLLHHDYRVLEAENAERAFAVWRDERDNIDLLLTDMVMPGSANGLDLAQQLQGEVPDLKVIYTSGYSAELFASDVKLEDGRNYLPKPYLSHKLIDILRTALEPGDTRS